MPDFAGEYDTEVEEHQRRLGDWRAQRQRILTGIIRMRPPLCVSFDEEFRNLINRISTDPCNSHHAAATGKPHGLHPTGGI